MKSASDSIVYRPKTRQQIADEYGISRRTLFRWFKKEGIRIKSGLVKYNDLKLIYETFGPPPKKLP